MSLKEMDKALKSVGRYYVTELKNQLAADGNKASGRLIKSIKSSVSDSTINISVKDYIGAISEGKKSTGKEPSPAMVSRIAEWMQYKKLSIRGYRGRFVRKTPMNYKRAAFGIARGINRSSWSGSDVIMRSYRNIEKNISDELLEVLKRAIDEAVDKITQTK
jgi:transposase InsO family protein